VISDLSNNVAIRVLQEGSVETGSTLRPFCERSLMIYELINENGMYVIPIPCGTFEDHAIGPDKE
jgi:hypothetical protein